MPPAVLFANPTAQSGKAEALIKRASELLSAAGVEHDFVPTAPDSGTVGLVRRAVDERGARTVIYMGGDGTFAEIAKGVLASDSGPEVALGMLPTGTANDQGKSFGIRPGASALRENVEVIAAGHATQLDVGRVQRLDEADQVTHSDLFFDSFSVGFGAETLRTRNRDRTAVERVPVLRSLYRDQLVYAGALFRQLLAGTTGGTRFDMEMLLDGEHHYFKSLLDVIVKNTRIFGGEWILAPDAQPDDGLFEVVPITGRREFTAKALATHRHAPVGEQGLRALGFEPSEPMPAKSILLTVIHPGATQPPAAQIDGEELTPGDKFRVEVLPRLLRLLVPSRR